MCAIISVITPLQVISGYPGQIGLAASVAVASHTKSIYCNQSQVYVVYIIFKKIVWSKLLKHTRHVVIINIFVVRSPLNSVFSESNHTITWHSSVQNFLALYRWFFRKINSSWLELKLELELENLLDPIMEFWYPGINSGLVFLGTTDAPTDDSGKHKTTVFTLYNHWATTVTL